MKHIVYLIPGFLALGVAAVGAVVPLLPTVPFLLLAAFCFARSSTPLHSWFIGTALYRKNLESYVDSRSMSIPAKLRIMASITLLLGFGVFMMWELPVPRTIVMVVWLLHILYFTCGVRTLRHTAPQGGRLQ